MNHAIAITGLTKYYGERCVVNNLQLNVPTGCVYGLLGRNGAGKSTTIKMLMGLVRPDRGHATLLGEPADAVSPATRAQIAYLAENHPMYKWMTIDEAIGFTRAFYPKWNDRLVDQILDHFSLSRKAKVRRLSNGQKAQVALALAVAPEPKLIILDDPALGLDTVVRRDFLESMVQIIQQSGRTILFSSHILGDVERVADRIGIMVDGSLRVDCPTDHFKQSVRKVVARYAGSAPDVSKTPGLVRQWVVGDRIELILVGWDDAKRNHLVDQGMTIVNELEMNLEDTFIEYTRGPKRSLPIFAEAQHV